MPTVKDLIEYIANYKEDTVIAYSLWFVEDVLCQADNDDKQITVEEANEILQAVHAGHDASEGINWDVLSSYISEHSQRKE